MSAYDIVLHQRNSGDSGFDEKIVTSVSTGKFLRVGAGNVIETYNLTKSDVGLSNVDNIQQIPLSYLSTDIELGTSDTLIPTQNAIFQYVNSYVDGRSWGKSVEAFSDTNQSISGLANGSNIDGVDLATGDRVLLNGQTDPTENGIYLIGASGPAVRDETTTTQANRAFWVNEGTVHGDTAWFCSNNSITFGVTSIAFVQVGSGSQPDATTTVKGIVELADNTEAKAKTSSTVAVTPSALADFVVTSSVSSTDNSIARFDGTTGELIQNSLVTIDDSGSINIPSGQSYKINNVALSKSDVGLGNVTNNAQINKAGSSTNGYIPKWSGTTGDVLVDGYGVHTTISDSDLFFPTSGAVVDYLSSLNLMGNWVSAPATSSSAGTAGQKAYDNDYFYVCVATNTWKRTPLATIWS